MPATEAECCECGKAITINGPGGRMEPGSYWAVCPAASEAIANEGQTPIDYLRRHASGDWGTIGTFDTTEVTADDLAKTWDYIEDTAVGNKVSMTRKDGGHVYSGYQLGNGREVYIGTVLDGSPSSRIYLDGEFGL